MYTPWCNDIISPGYAKVDSIMFYVTHFFICMFSELITT